MLRLTEAVGTPVATTSERRLGKLVDIVVDVGAPPPSPPVVTRLVLSAAHRRDGCTWIGAGDVVRLDGNGVEVRDAAIAEPVRDAAAIALAPQELLLVRDVLDAQIVDLAGHRLVRAADVLLTEGEQGALLVIGVDVGFRTVLHRLGLGRHRAGAPPQVVAWSDLHLTSRRGHDVQLVSANAHLHRLSSEDLAHLLARLSTSHAGAVLDAASVERVAGAISASHDEVGRRLLASMDEADADAVLAALPAARSHSLRHALARTARPARRYHRTRGWKRHAPPDGG